MLSAWYDDSHVTRETWLRRSDIAVECEDAFGQEVDDTDATRGKIAAWFRAKQIEAK